MFTSIPKSWHHMFDVNVTLRELNDALVTLHVPAIAIIMTLMIIGIIGNMAVLRIYFPYPKSFSRVFILWLGFIDLIACCFGMPLLLVSLYHPYEFPSVYACKTFRCVHVFLVAASVFIFVFIAYERHRAICNFEVVEMKPARMHMMCLISCMLAFVVSIPAVVLYGERTVNTGVFNITGIECFVEDHFEETIWPKVYFPFQLMICSIAFVILVILYIKIGRQLNWHLTFSRRYSRAPSDMRTSYLSEQESDTSKLPGRGSKTESLLKTSFSQENSSGQTKAHAPLESAASTRSCHIDRVARELTTMFCWLTVVFVLSFIPHLAIIVFQMFYPTFTQDMSPNGIRAYNIFFRSFVINNMANPVVYFICMRDFRNDCKQLLCKC
ncbi:alpha-2Db adrenergic receptor-like [Dreissena polymorpha]|uniref:G-protein coupled receptors family 1 profile domain-containing protein n=1 Tax=Dreissena polymorpha TaxID=45954 RepID=A0A9D4BY40_DREPO|nr:alpha-2Db adrenergic receptor-like [Dreissena polymorpha]KAH3713133.1 hypothetical protein DPMN_072917 [Dreissena polymorpha]